MHPPTLRAAISESSARLAEAGVPSPRFDAEELLGHVLGLSRGVLLARVAAGDALTEQTWSAYDELVAERARRVPLQHLTGTAWFRGLALAVGPGVFVPRPETEVVTQAVVDEAARLAAAGRAPVVVDLGTGSGAIALAVATEVRTAAVHAVEREPAAHAWASRNLATSGVDLCLGDLATAFADLDGTVDVVVSNPPYVPRDQVPVDPEVREHDPDTALYGEGADGLDAVRAVVATAARLLRPGGLLVVEHADTQGASAPAAVRAGGGWRHVTDHADLAGRPRFVTARREDRQP